MKAFNDYANIQVAKATEKLPVGGYVLKINNVRYEEGNNGGSDRLVLAFDIAEGEYKDFYKKQYDANTSENKRWKGTAQIYVPTDDGSENDKWTKQTFKRWMEAFEDSNPGYSWNWDENTLKGKLVGGVFGEEMSTIKDDDGKFKDITYVKVRYSASVNDIRKGSYKIPAVKDKRTNGNSGNTTSAGGNDPFIVTDNIDIPF